MDRNFTHQKIMKENRIKILKILYLVYPKELDTDNLLQRAKEQKIERATLYKYILVLEKEGLIKRIPQKDKRKNNYKLTSKGSTAVDNELDNETKGKIFSLNVFVDLTHLIRGAYIFDDRISDKSFRILFDMMMTCFDERINFLPESSDKLHHELQTKYFEIITAEKINLSGNLVLRNEYFSMVSKYIGIAYIFIVSKYMETKDIETLNMLQTLPKLIHAEFLKYGISPTKIKDSLRQFNILDDFETYYEESQNITPDKYKEVTEWFRKDLPEDSHIIQDM